jgi:hypothetical protein
LDAALLATNNNGRKELIAVLCTALRIDVLDGLNRVLAFGSLTKDQALESAGKKLALFVDGASKTRNDLHLDTFPTLIAVHSVVTSNDSGDLTNANLLDLLDKLLHVVGTALGLSITTITEEVNEDLRDLHLLGELQKSIQVSLLGVNTTVANKTLQAS